MDVKKNTLFLVVILIYVSLLRAQYLSSSVTRDGYQMWAPSLNSATQTIMQQLNRDKTAGESILLNKIDLEHTKVSQGVLHSVGLELDMGAMKNTRYEFSFLQPTADWSPLWGALPLPEPQGAPSTTPLSTALSTANEHNHYTPRVPELSMTLRGPLELYLHNRATELHIRTPREVDVGYIEKIVLANGVNMTVSGFSELHLKEPLVVNALPSTTQDSLLVSTKNTPKLTFVGSQVDISNASATEPLKVKKRSLSEIEVLSATEMPLSTHPFPFEIPINDSRLQTLQYGIQQLADSEKAEHPPVLRRLLSTKLEAVTSFFIPLEVSSSKTGEKVDWEVVVVHSANRHVPPRIVSLNKKPVITELSYDNELAANGTLASAVQDFLAGRPEYRVAL